MLCILLITGDNKVEGVEKIIKPLMDISSLTALDFYVAKKMPCTYRTESMEMTSNKQGTI